MGNYDFSVRVKRWVKFFFQAVVDCVNIPAGMKNWHSAAPDSWFSHLAIEVPGENGSNEWLEPVDAEIYDKL